MDILGARLLNQGLSAPFADARAVIARLGAVQAQDWAAAKWSLGRRLPQPATDASLEEAFSRGEFLRTHVLRPTWHLVMPDDIRWMLKLTAPNVKQSLAHHNRKLELDGKLLSKTNEALTRALENHKYLTRQELKAVLTELGVTTDVQRLAHIIMWAELDGLIASGPLRGRQFTYALLSERAPANTELAREEASAELARRYFRGHGPAQLVDFRWWSGLPAKDAQAALDAIKPELQSASFGDKTYWAYPGGTQASPPPALLLSIFDEYAIAYKDRTDLSESRDLERMLSTGAALTAVIILRGKVAGTWKRTVTKTDVHVTLSPFRKLAKGEESALNLEITRYARFFGRKAQ